MPRFDINGPTHRTAFVACLCIPTICLAEGVGGFAIAQLFFWGLGAMALAGLALFVSIGGWKGFLAYAAALLVGGTWFNVKVKREAHLRSEQFDNAHTAIRSYCHSEAGEFGSGSIQQPSEIFVRIDPRFRSDSGLHDPIRIPPSNDRVHLVAEFPAPRPAFTAYVDISLIRETIPNAPGHWLRGVSTVITSDDETVIAKRIDIERHRGWCLGADANSSTERFVLHWLGMPIGLTHDSGINRIVLPTEYPIGTASPLETGRFAERVRPYTHSLSDGPDGIATFLQQASCTFEALPTTPGLGTCGKNSSPENRINLSDTLGIQEFPKYWVLLNRTNGDISALDSLDVVARSKDGSAQAAWRIRFSGISDNQYQEGWMAADNLVIDDSGLAVDILLDRQTALVDTPSGAVTGSAYTEWFARRLHVKSNLPGIERYVAK